MIGLHELVYTMPLVIVVVRRRHGDLEPQVLSPWMLVFPFYSLAQVLVMPPIGAAYYFVVAWRRRRLGRYGFGFRRLRIAPVELETRLAPWVKLEHRRIASYGLGEQGRPV